VRYLNVDQKGTKHFPGFSVEAAIWLVENRNIWGLGVDTISFDPGYDNEYPTHKALESRDGWAIEALANLDELPAVGAVMVVGAINVRSATGGLVRPVALWTDASTPTDWRPALSGQWRSAAPELLPNGSDGRPRYMVRTLNFDRDRWFLNFAVYGDVAATELLFSGHNEGTFEVSADRATDGAYSTQFVFERRTLTPGTQDDDVADALTQAGCGEARWRPGEEQSVFEKGCPAFRAFSRSECPNELDVVKFTAGQLFLGSRPADGFMCREDRRPTGAGAAALLRVP
jgi:hypothetical protein